MENKKEKFSFGKKLDKLNKEVDDKSCFDHLLLVYEVDDRGVPNSTIVKAQGSPVIVLGMIDVLLIKLESLREQVHQKIINAENGSKNVGGMSEEIKEKLRALEGRAKKAVEENNEEEMNNIKNEMKNIFMDVLEKSSEDLNVDFGIEKDEDEDGPSFPGDDFNIDDFKGM